MGYSFRLTTRVLLYAPSHRQDSAHHGLCYTSRGAMAGTRNSSVILGAWLAPVISVGGGGDCFIDDWKWWQWWFGG